MNANKNNLFFHWNLYMFSKAHFNEDFWRCFFSPAPFPSLTINPIQSLCLQVSSSPLLFAKEKIHANSPTLMDSPKVTCQQMHLRWEMVSLIIFKERTFWIFHEVYEYAKRAWKSNRRYFTCPLSVGMGLTTNYLNYEIIPTDLEVRGKLTHWARNISVFKMNWFTRPRAARAPQNGMFPNSLLRCNSCL